MAIASSLNFEYAGYRSRDMGVVNCHIGGSGLYEEIFMPTVEINEITIRGRDMPYHIDKKRNPIVFTLQLYFEDGFTDEQCNTIASWLDQPYYAAMSFSDDDYTKRYYVMPIGDSKIFHTGAKEGYLEIPFRNIDCFRRSPVYTTGLMDFSTNPVSGTETTISNNGNAPTLPVFEITKIGNGDLRIVNISNSGQEFKLSNLLDGEYIEVDNESGDIETNVPNTYRYKDHNGTYLEFVQGNNYLKVYGTCNLKIIYEMKYKN